MNDTTIDTIIEKLENGACVGGKCTPKGKAEKGFCICHEAAEALHTLTRDIAWADAKLKQSQTAAISERATLTAENEALAEQLECANQNMKAMNANGDKLREQLAQHQWHRVEDELPTKDDVYLALFSTGAYWLTSFFDEGWEVANHVVTHWMPLPSPPEQEVSDG